MKFRLRLVAAVMLILASCGGTSAPVATAPTAEAEIVAGRAALAAAQGEPHILWFWGAH